MKCVASRWASAGAFSAKPQRLNGLGFLTNIPLGLQTRSVALERCPAAAASTPLESREHAP
eukprot:1184583-Pyramimonas_sp.AAC.1